MAIQINIKGGTRAIEFGVHDTIRLGADNSLILSTDDGNETSLGSGGPSSTAYFVVTRSTDAPTNSTNLGALTSGLLKQSVAGSIATLSIAIAGTDYINQAYTTVKNGIGTPLLQRANLLFTSNFDLFDIAPDTVVDLVNVGPGAMTIGGVGSAVQSITIDTKGRILAGTGVAISSSLAKYIVQQSDLSLPNAQATGALATGLLKNTTATGVLSIAVAGTDYLTQAYSTIKNGAGASANQRANLKFSTSFTVTDSAPDTVIDLANVGPGAGTIGAAGSAVQSITLDAQGRVTAAIAVAIGSASAKYIVQQADASLPNAQATGALATGILKSTTSTGVLSIAVAGTDYQAPLTFTSGLSGTTTITNDFNTGVAGGQTLTFGTNASDSGTLRSTSNATKGSITIGEVPLAVFAMNMSIASGTSAVFDAVKISPQTVVLSGNTAITTAKGFNLFEINAPTYSAASALAITTGTCLFISGPPAGAGAGPATITNQSAMLVQGTWAGGTGTTGRGLQINPTFAPTGGTGGFRALDFDYTVNQTGGATGTVFGMRVNCTETAVGGVNNLINCQVGGTSKFAVISNGTQDPSAGYGIVASNSVGINLRFNRTLATATGLTQAALRVAQTLTLTGATHITTGNGLNVTEFSVPTYTCATAGLVIDQGATVRIMGAINLTGAGSPTITNNYSLWATGLVRFDDGLDLTSDGSGTANLILGSTVGTMIGTAPSQLLSLWGAGPITQPTSAAFTNNITAGGTTNQVDNYTSLTLYSTDAAAIRNNQYQLARKVKEMGDALRLMGAFG